MSKYSLGIKPDGLKIGEIEADGGMSTALTTPGKVHENTLKVTPNAATVNNFFAEGFVDPEISFSKRGLKDFACDLLTLDPEVIADLTGGTVTGAAPNNIFNEPIGSVVIERSVEVTDMQGNVWSYPRVSITASLVGEFTTTAPNVLRITGVVMQPEKAGLAAFSFGKPVIIP